MPIFNRIARSLGIDVLQHRLDILESHLEASRVADETYAAIEERFRGSTDVIKERQQQYLPYVESSLSQSKPLLDIGFGRGEWLTLLRDHGISAIGIDSNSAFVEQARAHGLDVSSHEVLAYLSEAKNQSFSAVTMFQVAEHLPLRVLENVLAHIHRTLIPGGVAIIEIPNIETTRVGAGTFWIDPTHVRPLFPDFLVFLAERAGFTTLKTLTSTPLDQSMTLHTDDQMSQMVQTLWNRVNGPGDFAVIAWK